MNFPWNLLVNFVLCRSLEKEISFDFGPSAEFAYLYSQCYELTTQRVCTLSQCLCDCVCVCVCVGVRL